MTVPWVSPTVNCSRGGVVTRKAHSSQWREISLFKDWLSECVLCLHQTTLKTNRIWLKPGPQFTRIKRMMCSVPDLAETLGWVGEVWPSEEEDTYRKNSGAKSRAQEKLGHSFSQNVLSLVWWHKPLIPVLKRQAQLLWVICTVYEDIVLWFA